MKKLLFLLTVLLLNLCVVQAQVLKGKIEFKNTEPPKVLKKLVKKGRSQNPGLTSGLAFDFSKFKPLSNAQFIKLNGQIDVIDWDKNGNPSVFSAHLPVSRSRETNDSRVYVDFLKGLLNLNLNPGLDFSLIKRSADEMGTQHLKMNLTYEGLPVVDAEYGFHHYANGEVFIHGNLLIPKEVPNIESATNVNIEYAITDYFHKAGINCHLNQSAGPLNSGIKNKQDAYWMNVETGQWHLVSMVNVTPNLRQNWDLIIDLISGKVLKAHSNVCNLVHNHLEDKLAGPLGSEPASGKDLFDITRNFNVWKEGSTYYLVDASRGMFIPNQSKMPADPVGGILTLDARNTSPSLSNFSVDLVRSSNNTWSDKLSISSQYNSMKAYEYFLNTFGRNSINGSGGTIVSIINVADDNGRSMDNAFWNGEAMFYGNGDAFFTKLAKSLDVGGHEMSHGVVQNTANLKYENESGALNESFADIFGAMIDRDDWKMGEDVVIKSFFPSGALRDLSNPHNGGTSRSQIYFQPNHVSEQYKGTEDNGGVHINSGIPNYAYYLFVQELKKIRTEEESKKIAERVFYHTLTNFLTRSSVFKDLRIGVEKSSVDLYSGTPDVLVSARRAFDLVGILGNSGGGTVPKKDLSVNPGKEYLVCTDANQEGLYLYDFVNQPVVLSNQDVLSKPSVIDNGTEIYFVNGNNQLYYLYYDQVLKKYVEEELDNDDIYRNVVGSKDGNLIAVLFTNEEDKIHVYDFVKEEWKSFKLYNPTYSNSVTGDVRYADQMDFDHSGEYLMYDAFNEISKSTGGEYTYWDIGFLHVFDKSKNTFGTGKIEKLIASLPENTSVGNPVFSKNSLDVVAFDYIESGLFSADYALLGANIEKSEINVIADNRERLAYSSYSVKDDKILFDSKNASQSQCISVKPLSASKISSGGNEQVLLNGGKWATWFAFGNRSLVGTTDPQLDVVASLEPNPFLNSAVLHINSKENAEVVISIFSSIGQNVFSERLKLFEGENKKSLNLNQLSSGLYQLVISDNNGSRVLKIIKG
ncbi:MAG: M4 family metallopeptidase [Saprospiraceae bacterium]|nr:M4 family metallopeptidase [Candidatus Vicinibacter affinis]